MMNYYHILVLLICWTSHRNNILACNRTFPPEFKFGIATASYQIEGAWDEDGKSENIWDHICHTTPNFIDENHNGDIACDSYHIYKEDVKILKDLGVNFYRFSISWSRILPQALDGSPINRLGVEYYRNLLEELKYNGIEPLVTIYHWDLPQILQDLGGWLNPEIVKHYAYYTRVCYEYFGDLVRIWFTFNEPKQTCLQGYSLGTMAPGIKLPGIAEYKCAHNLLKAHAKAYHIYVREFRETQNGRVGIVIDSPWYEPAKDGDSKSAERALQFTYGWFANPVYLGDYPKIMIDRVDYRSKNNGYSKSRLPKFTEEEVNYIKGTYDFLALNIYTSLIVENDEEADPEKIGYEFDLKVKTYSDPTWEKSKSSWLTVTPWAIRKMLSWLKKLYHNPEIFITENGFSDEGELNDTKRIEYHKEYLRNILDAVLKDNVNVTHYTAWSLMDNFEWSRGYTEKFGLYKVDFADPSRKRIPKASSKFYKNIIKDRCL